MNRVMHVLAALFTFAIIAACAAFIVIIFNDRAHRRPPIEASLPNAYEDMQTPASPCHSPRQYEGYDFRGHIVCFDNPNYNGETPANLVVPSTTGHDVKG